MEKKAGSFLVETKNAHVTENYTFREINVTDWTVFGWTNTLRSVPAILFKCPLPRYSGTVNEFTWRSAFIRDFKRDFHFSVSDYDGRDVPRTVRPGSSMSSRISRATDDNRAFTNDRRRFLNQNSCVGNNSRAWIPHVFAVGPVLTSWHRPSTSLPNVQYARYLCPNSLSVQWRYVETYRTPTSPLTVLVVHPNALLAQNKCTGTVIVVFTRVT